MVKKNSNIDLSEAERKQIETTEKLTSTDLGMRLLHAMKIGPKPQTCLTLSPHHSDSKDRSMGPVAANRLSNLKKQRTDQTSACTMTSDLWTKA